MSTKEPGYVYILINPSFKEDWVKIGRSVDLRARRCPVGAGHDGKEIPDQVRDEEDKKCPIRLGMTGKGQA